MSRNNKSKRTKAQRKIIRLQRIAKRFGLGGLYFFKPKYPWSSTFKYGFSKNNLKGDHYLKPITGVQELIELLSDESGSILNLDNKREYVSPAELRIELLILALADIK